MGPQMAQTDGDFQGIIRKKQNPVGCLFMVQSKEAMATVTQVFALMRAVSGQCRGWPTGSPPLLGAEVRIVVPPMCTPMI